MVKAKKGDKTSNLAPARLKVLGNLATTERGAGSLNESGHGFLDRMDVGDIRKLHRSAAKLKRDSLGAKRYLTNKVARAHAKKGCSKNNEKVWHKTKVSRTPGSGVNGSCYKRSDGAR